MNWGLGIGVLALSDRSLQFHVETEGGVERTSSESRTELAITGRSRSMTSCASFQRLFCAPSTQRPCGSLLRRAFKKCWCMATLRFCAAVGGGIADSVSKKRALDSDIRGRPGGDEMVVP